MLIRRAVLEAIRDNKVTLAFRRWKRPTVRAGGTLNTAVGVLRTEALEEVALEAISEADDARAAGYPNRAALLAELDRPGTISRFALKWEGEDPRRALAESLPDAPEAAALVARLAAMDARSSDAPWTRAALRLIECRPGKRAAELAEQAGQPRDAFKTRVRRLKALGLTESLATGYRLTPRGRAVLTAQEGRPEGKNGQDWT